MHSVLAVNFNVFDDIAPFAKVLLLLFLGLEIALLWRFLRNRRDAALLKYATPGFSLGISSAIFGLLFAVAVAGLLFPFFLIVVLSMIVLALCVFTVNWIST